MIGDKGEDNSLILNVREKLRKDARIFKICAQQLLEKDKKKILEWEAEKYGGKQHHIDIINRAFEEASAEVSLIDDASDEVKSDDIELKDDSDSEESETKTQTTESLQKLLELIPNNETEKMPPSNKQKDILNLMKRRGLENILFTFERHGFKTSTKLILRSSKKTMIDHIVDNFQGVHITLYEWLHFTTGRTNIQVSEILGKSIRRKVILDNDIRIDLLKNMQKTNRRDKLDVGCPLKSVDEVKNNTKMSSKSTETKKKRKKHKNNENTSRSEGDDKKKEEKIKNKEKRQTEINEKSDKNIAGAKERKKKGEPKNGSTNPENRYKSQDEYIRAMYDSTKRRLIMEEKAYEHKDVKAQCISDYQHTRFSHSFAAFRHVESVVILKELELQDVKIPKGRTHDAEKQNIISKRYKMLSREEQEKYGSLTRLEATKLKETKLASFCAPHTEMSPASTG